MKTRNSFWGKYLLSHLTLSHHQGTATLSDQSQNFRPGRDGSTTRLSHESSSKAQRGQEACSSFHSKSVVELTVENKPNSWAASQGRSSVVKSENCTMSFWEYSTGCTMAYIIQGKTIVFLLTLLSCVWQVVGTEKGVAVIHYDHSPSLPWTCHVFSHLLACRLLTLSRICIFTQSRSMSYWQLLRGRDRAYFF